MTAAVSTLLPEEGQPLVFGPHSIQTEQAILGAILANNKRFAQAESLRPEHFADPMNAQLFTEIARRVIAGSIADPVTLKDWIVTKTHPVISQLEASRYLTGLIMAQVSYDIAAYVSQLKDYWARRQIIAYSRNLISAAEDTNAEIAPATIEITDAVDAVLTDQSDSLDISFDEAMALAMKRVRDAKARGTHGGLVVPGMPRLSRRIAFLPGQLTILGGLPGEGKSALAWGMVISVAERIRDNIAEGLPRSEVGGIVGLSLEMSTESLAARALSAQSGIPVEVIETQVLTEDEIERLEQARSALARLPLRLIAMGGLTPTMMRMRMRQARRKLGGHIAMTVIDHVQLIEAEDVHARNGGAWATGKVADAILYMSKEFNTHVLALSQLDLKDISKRQEKRPTKGDIRWSANFANNADNILFVHRPEIHLPKAPPTQEDMEPDDKYQERLEAWRDRRERYSGKAELIGDKVRNGSANWVIKLFFEGSTTSFSEDPTQDVD